MSEFEVTPPAIDTTTAPVQTLDESPVPSATARKLCS